MIETSAFRFCPSLRLLQRSSVGIGANVARSLIPLYQNLSFQSGSLGFAVVAPRYGGGFPQKGRFLHPYVEKPREFLETLQSAAKVEL